MILLTNLIGIAAFVASGTALAGVIASLVQRLTGTYNDPLEWSDVFQDLTGGLLARRLLRPSLIVLAVSGPLWLILATFLPGYGS